MLSPSKTMSTGHKQHQDAARGDTLGHCKPHVIESGESGKRRYQLESGTAEKGIINVIYRYFSRQDLFALPKSKRRTVVGRLERNTNLAIS